MLKLRLSPEVEQFRQSLRVWLRKNKPPKLNRDSSLDSFVRVGRTWQRTLSSGGWIGVHWPSEYGGRGLSLVEEAVVQEELVRVGSPQILGLFGLTMVGPVLIDHGSPEQKQQFLRDILSGDKIWCQGFSEPGAGSDLAAIRTKATPEGEGFRLQGQKVWTSFAHIADWCFLLARTSEGKSKHEGLTYFLVDMREKGISTKPLKQISGDEEFNEVFFDNVYVPKSRVVGQIGEGWKIALATLMYERVVLTFARQLQSEVALRGMLKSSVVARSVELGEKLSRALSEACAVRALAYEHLLEYARGKRPGPEGSMDKLLWSESFQRVSELGMAIAGQAVIQGTEKAAAAGTEVHRYLYSRGRTIAAGTSEIQRSIIAERVLGLPRLKNLG